MTNDKANNDLPQPPQLLVTVEVAARMLAVGRTTLYGLIERGELATVAIGRARRVPVSALSEYVRSLALTA